MASPAGFLAKETVDQGLANLALCLVLYSLRTKNHFYIFKQLPGVFPATSIPECMGCSAPTRDRIWAPCIGSLES